MKKLTYLLLIAALCSFKAVAQESKTTSTSDWDKFYKHLGNNIKYPEKAKLVEAQGNSVILLNISDGVVKKFTVNNTNPELGFDEEVVQNLFTFKDFTKAQNGNYALITSYRIADSKSPIKNENYIIPKGYSELKLVVMGYSITKVGAVDTTKSNPVVDERNFKVVWRGNSYANADAKHPLVVVNDEVIEYSLMNLIDPKKIESVTILKDAASTLKYGNEAKNGVIIISTKDYVPKKTVK